jgi:hypothetical protein
MQSRGSEATVRLRPRYTSVPHLKSLHLVQRRELSSGKGTSLKLWDTVGCHSKHPILGCTPIRSNFTRFDVPASLEDFEESVYLNSTAHDSCSLVGSSGNLKNHKYGRLIDSKRVVIRINNPPMKGYEKFVGHRPADILMINNHLREGKCYQPKHHEILFLPFQSKVTEMETA